MDDQVGCPGETLSFSLHYLKGGSGNLLQWELAIKVTFTSEKNQHGTGVQ